MRDFWLQELSGTFGVSVHGPLSTAHGEQSHPARVSVRLNGNSSNKSSARGFALHARAFSVGIKGEKGTRVPSMNVEEVSIRAEVRARIPLVFNSDKHAWEVGRGFKFKLVKLDKKISGVRSRRAAMCVHPSAYDGSGRASRLYLCQSDSSRCWSIGSCPGC